MKRNIGSIERGIRSAFGMVFLGLPLLQSLPRAASAGAVGAGMLVLLTALTGFSPLYRFFRVSTSDGRATR